MRSGLWPKPGKWLPPPLAACVLWNVGPSMIIVESIGTWRVLAVSRHRGGVGKIRSQTCISTTDCSEVKTHRNTLDCKKKWQRWVFWFKLLLLLKTPHLLLAPCCLFSREIKRSSNKQTCCCHEIKGRSLLLTLIV